MKNGNYIIFEGPEGCGKTTQIEIVQDKLIANGLEIITTREPGGTEIGEKIRTVLLDPESKQLLPKAELMLYLADRAQHYGEVIKPSLKAGKIILSDRGPDATLLYQEYARGLDLTSIKQLNDFVLENTQPNLTIFITGDPEYFLKRAWKSIEENDDKLTRFEEETIKFHRKIVEGMHKLAPTNERYAVIEDNEGDTEGIVNEKIMKVIKERLNLP